MDHNYTMFRGIASTKTIHDIEIIKGEGPYLYDSNNKRYVDLSSGLWNVSLGYDKVLNSRVKDSFSEILDLNLPYLDMTSYYSDIYNQTANNIKRFVGENLFSKVLFTNSGSESLELALKITNALSKKKKVLSFSKSYHGTFYGGMSLSGISKEVVKNHNPVYDNNITMDMPRTETEEQIFLDAVLKISNELAAVFIEPIIGSGGIVFASINFYNKLLKICKENCIIVVFDEVATGFYKTGTRFFFNKLKHSPDILCLSKSLNNGILPTGCVLINHQIYSTIEGIAVKHMSTQNGNLLCQATINCTLDYYSKFDTFLLNNVKQIESITEDIKQKYNINIRNMGSIISIPLKNTNLSELLKHLKESGILTFSFNTEEEYGITLFPPINIDLKLYEKTLNYIAKVVKKYE